MYLQTLKEEKSLNEKSLIYVVNTLGENLTES